MALTALSVDIGFAMARALKLRTYGGASSDES